MPASRRMFSSCSHKGFGANCHRCAEAEKLEAQAKKTAGEEAKKLKAEAERLRGPQRKKGERMSISPAVLQAAQPSS